MSVYTKSYPAPKIDEKEILRYAGIAKNKSDESVMPLLRECIAELDGRLCYKVCYREFEIKRSASSLDLGFLTTESKSLQKNLDACHSVVLFAATVGIELDRLIARYSLLSPAKALLFQAIGAERVEALCESFCAELLQEKNREGETIRPRFSAGFGDFPLTFQRDIFAALDCQKHIGVSLGESLLMSPSKSVTALVGIEKPVSDNTTS